MPKALPTICLLLVLTSLCVVEVRANETPTASLRVGIEDYYPPFAFTDEGGNHTGFDHEIAVALCREMKRDCIFFVRRLDDLLSDIVTGKLDMVVAGLRIIDDLVPTVDFSKHYFRSRAIYLGRHNLAPLDRKQLAGKKLGVQEGTLHASHARSQWGDAAQIVEDSHENIMDMLVRGELDVVLVDGLAGYEFLKSEEGHVFELLDNPAPSEDRVNYAHVGVRKSAKGLLDAVNDSLERIWLNGEYYRINRKYFPFGIY